MVNHENDGFCSVINFYFCSHVQLNKLVLHCIVRKKHINVAMKLYGRLGCMVCLAYPASHVVMLQHTQ